MERSLDRNLVEFIEREMDLEHFKIEMTEYFPNIEDRILIFLLYFGMTIKEVATYLGRTIPEVRAKLEEMENKLLNAWDIDKSRLFPK